jgi:hypothetical protein
MTAEWRPCVCHGLGCGVGSTVAIITTNICKGNGWISKMRLHPGPFTADKAAWPLHSYMHVLEIREEIVFLRASDILYLLLDLPEVAGASRRLISNEVRKRSTPGSWAFTKTDFLRV